MDSRPNSRTSGVISENAADDVLLSESSDAVLGVVDSLYSFTSRGGLSPLLCPVDERDRRYVAEGVEAVSGDEGSLVFAAQSLLSSFWWWKRPSASLLCVDTESTQRTLLNYEGRQEFVEEEENSVIYLTVAEAKRELALVYAAYDSARAASTMAASVAPCASSSRERCKAGEHVVMVPVDEDWDEAVHRGIPLVVILRFTLWAYVTRLLQRRHREFVGPQTAAPVSATYSLPLDGTNSRHVDIKPPATGADGYMGPDVSEGGNELLSLPLPLPQFMLGVSVNRADWLEMLAVFAPPEYAATLLRRALGCHGSDAEREGKCSVFLSWRHAGATDGTVKTSCDMLGVNSARHGAAHPRSAFRTPSTPTQVFLFHGEPHVLHHLDGIVQCTVERVTPACVHNIDESSVVNGGDVDVSSSDGCVHYCAVALRSEHDQKPYEQRGFLENDDNDNDDNDTDFIVSFAEALLLPGVCSPVDCANAAALCETTGGDQKSSAEEGRREDDDVALTTRGDILHSVPPPISFLTANTALPVSSTLALPDTLTSVCGGVFCLPRSFVHRSSVTRTLAHWGFDPMLEDHSECNYLRSSNGVCEDSVTDVTASGNDNHRCLHEMVSRRLPLSTFMERLSCDVLFCPDVATAMQSSSMFDGCNIGDSCSVDALCSTSVSKVVGDDYDSDDYSDSDNGYYSYSGDIYSTFSQRFGVRIKTESRGGKEPIAGPILGLFT